ncbi:NADP-dependent oxidoreductase [Limosilactobacillus reuteri]|uniref:NADP-dependent oxidoreductase n=1 Tax=Limosilactobacillus reuteri TaxID=1598 RepID=UPI001E2ED9FF|nr:NADP-dependent oxidoreductase [Limosilactobacillus reuteri]MCC4414697.1 NADP-dependent oxidoreductase [Limosilactobacillus reuteri]
MKAAQLTKYNKKTPQILISNASLPPFGPDDLLIEVKAAGVNPLDNLIAHGDLKLVTPYKLPQILGNEFVGLVQQAGKNVTKFKVGDRVYGRNPVNNIGAFAEELVVNQSAVAHVPEYLTDQEAASVPLTALTAIQALELLQAQPGQTLFISGGTGSFGAMAIPIAVAKGLKVITSGSPQKQQYVEQLGVSKFIDYTKEDYTKVLSGIDLVIDTLGGTELIKQMAILRPHGKLVSLRGIPNKEFAKRMKMSKFKQGLFSIASRSIEKEAAKKKIDYQFLFVTANGQQLADASQVLVKNQIHPAIGKIFSLNEVSQAMEKVQQGHNKGKIIIDMSKK